MERRRQITADLRVHPVRFPCPGRLLNGTNTNERTRTIATHLPFTDHASRRLAQRNFSEADVRFVLAKGLRLRRAGATWFVLRRSDLRFDELRQDVYRRLVGVVVCLEQNGVSTVYRNPRPVRHVLRKAKFNRRKSATRPPCAVSLAASI